ncbi:MAG: hypothetical protein ACPGVO_10435 [Spirulinaceae cyanobacterium]
MAYVERSPRKSNLFDGGLGVCVYADTGEAQIMICELRRVAD